MDWELAFTIANVAVVPAWVAIAVAPGHLWVRRGAPLVATGLIAVAYVALLITGLAGDGDGGFGSLADVRLMFERDVALLTAWIHYLAFDLFVGSWIAQDARSRGLSRLIVAPFLLLTLMLGPAGLLGYWILRASWHRDACIEFAPPRSEPGRADA